jgi:negative regulator of flagellin synthesis FlgM
MQVYGAAHTHGAQPINPPHHSRTTASSAAVPVANASGDELSISEAGSLLEQIGQLPGIRHERVSAVRSALAAGTYETDEKLQVALDRLLDEIG